MKKVKNEMPNKVAFSDMTTMYGPYLMAMKPKIKAIETSSYYIGISEGLDGQSWVVFKDANGITYHKMVLLN